MKQGRMPYPDPLLMTVMMTILAAAIIPTCQRVFNGERVEVGQEKARAEALVEEGPRSPIILKDKASNLSR